MAARQLDRSIWWDKDKSEKPEMVATKNLSLKFSHSTDCIFIYKIKKEDERKKHNLRLYFECSAALKLLKAVLKANSQMNSKANKFPAVNHPIRF